MGNCIKCATIVATAATVVMVYYKYNRNSLGSGQSDEEDLTKEAHGSGESVKKAPDANDSSAVESGAKLIEKSDPTDKLMDDDDEGDDHGSESQLSRSNSGEQLDGAEYAAEDDSRPQSDTVTAESMLYDRWRLRFNEKGELREEDGGRFRFDAYGTDRMANQERYEDIGKLTEAYVYELLEAENRGNLEKTYLQTDGKGTFIFVSKNWEECDKLLVLIHGSGAVRAGQWARRLIINDNLESGTQLPYITRANSRKWGVIVMNTNDNHNGVEGSKSPNEHGLYVWKHFVRKSQAKKIAIVAHSAGGSVTASMVSDYFEDFRKRVYAIAYTDSFGSPHGNEARKYFEDVTCNWVTGIHKVGTPMTGRGVRCVCAGTTKHEETSHYAIDDIFKYIEERFERTSPVTTAKPKKRAAEQASSSSSSKDEQGTSGSGQGKNKPTSETTKKPKQHSNTVSPQPQDTCDDNQRIETVEPTHSVNLITQSKTNPEEKVEERGKSGNELADQQRVEAGMMAGGDGTTLPIGLGNAGGAVSVSQDKLSVGKPEDSSVKEDDIKIHEELSMKEEKDLKTNVPEAVNNGGQDMKKDDTANTDDVDETSTSIVPPIVEIKSENTIKQESDKSTEEDLQEQQEVSTPTLAESIQDHVNDDPVISQASEHLKSGNPPTTQEDQDKTKNIGTVVPEADERHDKVASDPNENPQVGIETTFQKRGSTQHELDDQPIEGSLSLTQHQEDVSTEDIKISKDDGVNTTTPSGETKSVPDHISPEYEAATQQNVNNPPASQDPSGSNKVMPDTNGVGKTQDDMEVDENEDKSDVESMETD